MLLERDCLRLLTGHHSSGVWDETISVFGCFDVQCYVLPTSGEELEQAMFRVCKLGRHVTCP